MTWFRRLLVFFSPSALDPEVMVSQIDAFSRQVPLLYVFGNANCIALAYTHYNSAPKLLTLIVPVPMFLICLVRVIVWYRARRESFTPEKARERLRATMVMAGVLGAVYAAWALCLFPYGDAAARCHVAFFMSITVIGTIFCLMHLLAAALLLTAIVGIPFFIRFTSTGDPVLVAIAINFLLVVMIMVFVLFIYYRDFTNLVQSKKALAALSDENFRVANLDSLTGLPNRRAFFRDAGLLLNTRRADGAIFALGMIDLDGFKPVNDVYGHAAGDRVLIEVGRRLRETLGPTALVARLGGDEFGLMLQVPRGEPDVLATGAAIREAIRQPIALPTGMARVAASIGFALTSARETSREHLVEQADYALYNAKAKHRGMSVIFSAHHENAIRVQSLIEQELRRADFEGEMSVKFQPIVDVGRDVTMAYEALARWRSPALGEVQPLAFIAAAERTGQINDLTAVLFAKALAAMASWPPAIGLSFNLSVNDISSPDLIERVRAMIGQSAIAPERIAFEITETALIHDFEEARAVLLRLKTLGVKIALDDFGTGYSSLMYVHRLPLDKIKIDRGFIKDIAADKSSRDIVKSIVDLCRNLHITCVVEGIETAEQATILRALGCRAMQGFFFGRPETSEVLSALFERDNATISDQRLLTTVGCAAS